ncbi:MAG: PTS sugar transporter subunit IIB [Bacteroidales bacterium]|nr:PTS sugar transporter subunit IIB [Bacteroidales bacterium]
MIKLIRIDDRLVHGQVAFTWVPSLGVDYIIVANDKVAKDDFLKMTMGLAKPPTTKLLILTVENAQVFLNDQKSRNLKILLLVTGVGDAYALATSIPEIKSINFGGIRIRDGARLISKAVAVSDEDIAVIRKMVETGIELEIRQVPTDKKLMVKDLI